MVLPLSGLPTTALLPLVTCVANDFNEQKPPTCTGMVTIDTSKVVDAVDHTFLIQQISNSDLHLNIIRWLSNYQCGRTASCIFQSAKLPKMIIHSSTPQGGVLSPDIYNHFTSDFPENASQTERYADDVEVAKSSPNINIISTARTEDLSRVSQWAKDKNLIIAPNKSSVTLYS
jgi:hypothetical protein